MELNFQPYQQYLKKHIIRILNSSFERGTSEKHNGLIRRMLPKGEMLEDKPNNYIEEIKDYLNNYPREILVFTTQNEMF